MLSIRLKVHKRPEGNEHQNASSGRQDIRSRRDFFLPFIFQVFCNMMRLCSQLRQMVYGRHDCTTGEMGPESGWSQRELPVWPGARSCKAGPPWKPREGLWTSWHYLFKFLWIKNYLKIKIRKLAYTTTKTNQKKIFFNWNYIFDSLIFAESLFGLI